MCECVHSHYITSDSISVTAPAISQLTHPCQVYVVHLTVIWWIIQVVDIQACNQPPAHFDSKQIFTMHCNNYMYNVYFFIIFIIKLRFYQVYNKITFYRWNSLKPEQWQTFNNWPNELNKQYPNWHVCFNIGTLNWSILLTHTC